MSNRIHPTAIVGAGVTLGRDNEIGPFTVIAGPCRIGDGNVIGPLASIGGPAEYLGAPHPAGWEGEVAGVGVVIGDGTTIREFVTVNQGTGEPTTVGDRCRLLARSHVGHDSVLHEGVLVGSGAQLGGHTHVWPSASIGAGTVVHQRVSIGPGASTGIGTAVRRDVRPFTVVGGNPARVTGVHHAGLLAHGCTEDEVTALEPFLTGKAELPAVLPAALADLLTEWAKTAGNP